MAEYGAPFDLRELPGPMVEAHLAILRGRVDRRRDDTPDGSDVPDQQEVTQHGYRQ
jgi:hypothetical protein